MSESDKTAIAGYWEQVSSELRGDVVVVVKTHYRSSEDAAVPPGQAIEFEFDVASFPMEIMVTSGAPVAPYDRPGEVPLDLPVRQVIPLLPVRHLAMKDADIAKTSTTATTSATVTRATTATITSTTQAMPAGATTTASTAMETTTASTILARRRQLDFGGFHGGVLAPPEPPEPPRDAVVPFEITLTPPNGLQPTVLTNPMVSQIRSWPSDTASARDNPEWVQRARGKWKISVRSTKQEAQRIFVQVKATYAVTPPKRQEIPLSLLNNLASVALQKTLPRIEYDSASSSIVVSTPTHFLDLMGIPRSFDLGWVAAKVIDGLPTFTPLSGRIVSRNDFVGMLKARRLEIYKAISEIAEKYIPAHSSGQTGQALLIGNLIQKHKDAIEVIDKEIATLEGFLAQQAAFCLVLDGMFTDPEINLAYVGEVADITNTLPQIGYVFDERLEFTAVITSLSLSLNPALSKVLLVTAGAAALTALAALTGGVLAALLPGAAVALGIGGYNTIDDLDVEEMIRTQLRKMGPLIAGYARGAIERITEQGASAMRCRIRPRSAADGSDTLEVVFCNPSKLPPPRGRTILDPGVVQGPLPAQSGSTSTPIRMLTQEQTPIARLVLGALDPLHTTETHTTETPVQIPSEFEIPSEETLARLDKHDCIVVLMMENRSYDHFFYELPLAYPGKGYSSPPPSYRNAPPPGWREPFAPVRTRDIGLGTSLYFPKNQRGIDLGHNYERTMVQLGDGTGKEGSIGAMQGFALDFAQDSDSPQIATSYFPIDDLPVYKGLAKHYPVCDRWFAALPVGTYPNRLAALQGNVPYLYNPEMDDPSLGYLEDYSIFDVFNSQGISWKFFESDLGTIRLYDRYRLDVRNVRPVRELDRTLLEVSRGAPLPRAMFIEPAFLYGNDDHPPVDVKHGQEFIREVIGTFIKHKLLDRVLFVITYDEHGGFFDHVPPPGTPHAGDPIEPIYVKPAEASDEDECEPQRLGTPPTCMGVRVPSLVLSKYSSPRANHTVLDHTAILKTLLLHNRRRVAPEQFLRFGERVMKRGHLGQVLDLESPRAIDYDAVARDIGFRQSKGLVGWIRALVTARAAGLTPTHPANVMRGIALPRRRV